MDKVRESLSSWRSEKILRKISLVLEIELINQSLNVLLNDPMHLQAALSRLTLPWPWWLLTTVQSPGTDHSCVHYQPIRRLFDSFLANKRTVNTALQLFNVKCLGEMSKDDLSDVWPWGGRWWQYPGILMRISEYSGTELKLQNEMIRAQILRAVIMYDYFTLNFNSHSTEKVSSSPHLVWLLEETLN